MASSLTIAPSLGHSLVTAQGMAGGYDAIDDRSFWQAGLQEGAVGATDFMVVERGAGANMTVDVGCNTGFVLVQGDTVTNQGLYVVRPHPSVANLDIATAHGTNPRVDSVVVQVDDDEHDASGNTRARAMVLTGTATGGATLDNRTGAPALPNSAMLLADVLVPAADTTISNSQIRDRRKWARGASYRYERTAGNYTTASTSFVDMDATNLKPRIECSGVPVRITVGVSILEHNVASATVTLGLVVGSASAREKLQTITTAQFFDSALVWEFTPAAGSTVINLQWKTTSGTATMHAVGTQEFSFSVEEIVRQNTKNNATTSG